MLSKSQHVKQHVTRVSPILTFSDDLMVSVQQQVRFLDLSEEESHSVTLLYA